MFFGVNITANAELQTLPWALMAAAKKEYSKSITAKS